MYDFAYKNSRCLEPVASYSGYYIGSKLMSFSKLLTKISLIFLSGFTVRCLIIYNNIDVSNISGFTVRYLIIYNKYMSPTKLLTLDVSPLLGIHIKNKNKEYFATIVYFTHMNHSWDTVFTYPLRKNIPHAGKNI